MFRIRRVFDDVLQVNRDSLEQARIILQEQFPLLSPEDLGKLPDLLANPMKHRFKSILYVAEDHRGRIHGFALLSHDPQLRFGYLDYISAAKGTTGRGIGGALYDRVREEALSLGEIGIFFECLPDDPALCRDPETLKQNQARLKFYEKYGAFPLIGTSYEAPVKEEDDNPPYLVFDDLGQGSELGREQTREIVRAILERKYGDLCPRDYVQMVVDSIQDDPVRLRAPRYLKKGAPTSVPVDDRHRRIALVINDRHAIHHVRERGYVESPVRIRSILREIEPTGLFLAVPPEDFPEKHIRAVHAADYLEYFKRVCKSLEPGKSVYPYVFPVRNAARPPKELAVRAGYYCIDTFTPLNQNAYLAAKRSVDCALTAADQLLAGFPLAYALVRPPGHHAESRVFGGFCYFNNGAIAANYLSRFGKVAILDIDYHHGNGQQEIFYRRGDVLTVSVHGHPSFAYPYFSGFEDEHGEGEGEGANINFPLPEHLETEAYLKTLEKALRRIAAFKPANLVVSLGLDTAKGDPTGTWNLTAKDFERVGKLIGTLGLQTLVVQEGGYKNRGIGTNARHFFVGLWNGRHGAS